MAEVSDNIFAKCLPAFTSDIKACGGPTTCSISPATQATLESFFHDGTNYKVFGALILAEFEINACDVEQNGLYELIMSTRTDWSKRMNWTNMGGGLYEIKPFVMAARKSVLNNEYWTVSNGEANGGNWQVDVVSQTGIPADVRWFLAPEHVYIFGKTAGGTATETAWRIVSSTKLSAIAVRLVLASQNTNSFMPAVKLGNPTTGFLIRGVGNVNDYESWCLEGPGLNLNQRVPFWIGTTRMATCEDELFNKYREALVKDNAYFATFKDVDTVEKNRQLGMDFKRKMVNGFFYDKALVNQDLTNYPSLDEITSATPGSLTVPGSGKCVGRRAQPIGIIEQLWECKRGADLQGQPLNLIEFFNNILYDISRVRSPDKDGRIIIESMTDSFFAGQIQLAMVNYYNYQTGGKLQFTQSIEPQSQKGALGFWYRRYFPVYPNVEWRVVTHRAFDDMVQAAIQAGMESVGRVLWTIDWSDVYMAILESNRRVNKIGDIADLARVDSTIACAMKFPTETFTLTSTTYTNVVECPRRHFILRNIGSAVPEHKAPAGVSYSDYYGIYA